MIFIFVVVVVDIIFDIRSFMCSTQSGSCDSLFSKHDSRFTASNSGDSLSDAGGIGNSLEDDDASSKFSNGSVRQTQPQVPPLITACIDHLTNYGLHVVGIFRVSTSKRRIREVQKTKKKQSK